MSLGQTAPATPALSVGRLQPSVVSLRNREQQSLRLDVEIFQAPRGGAKAGPWPLAPRPRFPSRELPSSSSGVYASKSCVPRRAHLCGLAPPVSARPATSGQGPVAQTPSPRPGPPPSGFPAAATDSQPASPAKAVRRPTSALAAHRRFRPSAAAGGSVWRGGCREGSAPSSADQRPSRQAPRGFNAGSVGQARGGSPALRFGGPAGRSQTFLEQSKTRFNKNYKGMSLSKITTTVGLNIGTVDVGKARLMFWDLGGQEELQSLWDKYYAECHGVIYVIDSTDEERLSESKQAFEKMVTSEALDGVPILVLANKQDVETCLSIPDIKTAFSDCASKIGRRDCLTQACSALTGKGVREGIEWMVKCVVRNVHRPPRQRDIT
uniref:ADP-ribosylation factor-related protein 1 n=2 Tax=Capra hircus TaxID=9925 RepID=A0A8C2NV35_CAPHI